VRIRQIRVIRGLSHWHFIRTHGPRMTRIRLIRTDQRRGYSAISGFWRRERNPFIIIRGSSVS
jgi:hypothetical protein